MAGSGEEGGVNKGGWPKDKKRGPQNASHKAARSISTTKSMLKHFSDYRAGERLSMSMIDSYIDGRMSMHVIKWTKDMDTTLKLLRRTMSFAQCRKIAPKVLGVCDRQVVCRLHKLGLTKKARQENASELVINQASSILSEENQEPMETARSAMVLHKQILFDQESVLFS